MTREMPRRLTLFVLIPSALVVIGCLQRAEVRLLINQRSLVGKLVDKTSSLSLEKLHRLSLFVVIPSAHVSIGCLQTAEARLPI